MPKYNWHNSIEIPDSIEPILAYRVWPVQPDNPLTLTSIATETQWPDEGPLKAQCLIHRVSFYMAEQKHTAPAKACTCGIWALKDYHDVYSVTFNGYPKVFGMVFLWGRVIEGDVGYRAEFAKPAVFVKRHPPKVKKTSNLDDIAAKYNVPIVRWWEEKPRKKNETENDS